AATGGASTSSLWKGDPMNTKLFTMRNLHRLIVAVATAYAASLIVGCGFKIYTDFHDTNQAQPSFSRWPNWVIQWSAVTIVAVVVITTVLFWWLIHCIFKKPDPFFEPPRQKAAKTP